MQIGGDVENETGDYITWTQKFVRCLVGKNILLEEQYAIERSWQIKATTNFCYVDGGNGAERVNRCYGEGMRPPAKQVTLFHKIKSSPSEQAALDQKMFEYAKQFAGLNDALVAAVVKPEIDKFDELEEENKQQKEKDISNQRLDLVIETYLQS